VPEVPPEPVVALLPVLVPPVEALLVETPLVEVDEPVVAPVEVVEPVAPLVVVPAPLVPMPASTVLCGTGSNRPRSSYWPHP
jgi:hypothetical protein